MDAHERFYHVPDEAQRREEADRALRAGQTTPTRPTTPTRGGGGGGGGGKGAAEPPIVQRPIKHPLFRNVTQKVRRKPPPPPAPLHGLPGVPRSASQHTSSARAAARRGIRRGAALSASKAPFSSVCPCPTDGNAALQQQASE